MNSADWQIWIAECRKQELPCIPTSTEPWFSAQYVCGNFLCIERADRFIREWKTLGLPMLRIKNHPLIRMSDVERYGVATAAVYEQPERKPAGRKQKNPAA